MPKDDGHGGFFTPDELDRIRDEAVGDCERLFSEGCQRLGLDYHKEGNKWRAGDSRAVVLNVGGSNQGRWCHHQLTGGGADYTGDIIGWWCYANGWVFLEAISDLADRYGIRRGDTPAPKPRPQRVVPPPAKDRTYARRIAYARRMWQAAGPVTPDTPGYRYLTVARALSPAVVELLAQADAIRFHPAYASNGFEETERHPAVLFAARDLDGTLNGLQAIQLTPDGDKIADKARAKITNGSLTETKSALFLHLGTGDIVLAEGPEDAASIVDAVTNATVLAGAGTLARAVDVVLDMIQVAPTRRVILLVQNDADNSKADHQTRKAVERLLDAGANLWLARPRLELSGCKDINDARKAHGINGARIVLHGAYPVRCAAERDTATVLVDDIPARWPTSPVSLDEGRNLLKQELATATGNLALNVTPGTGKTEGIATDTANRPGSKLMLSPTTRMVAQTVEAVERQGGIADALYGRGYVDPKTGVPDCSEQEVVDAAVAAHLPVGRYVCQFCPQRHRGCAALLRRANLQMLRDESPDHTVVTAHNFITHHMAQEAGTGFGIAYIDERPNKLGFDVKVPLDRLEPELPATDLAQAIADAFDDYGTLRIDRLPKAWQAAAKLRKLAERLRPADKFDLKAILSDSTLSWERVKRELLAHAERMKRYSGWRVARLLDTLAEEIDRGRTVSNQIVLVRDECPPGPKRQAQEPRHTIHVYGRRKLAAHLDAARLVYIDGTTDRLTAQAVLGTECSYVAIDVERHLNVTQVHDKTFSASWLLTSEHGPANRARLIRFLKRQGSKAHYRNILIGSSQTVETVLKPEVEKAGLPCAFAWMHFGAERGVNDYRDYDAVFVIGRQEPPIWAVEAETRQLHPEHQLEPLRLKDWPKRLQGYALRSGQRVGVWVSYHPDPVAHSVLEQLRECCLVQLIDRLRGVLRAGNPPDVFLLTNIPTEIIVDRLVSLSALYADASDEPAADPWWLAAAKSNGGAAPASPKWLVQNGFFGNEEAAKRAVTRLRPKMGHDPHNIFYEGAVPFNLKEFRLPGDRGKSRLAIVLDGVTDWHDRVTAALMAMQQEPAPVLVAADPAKQVVEQDEPGAVELDTNPAIVRDDGVPILVRPDAWKNDRFLKLRAEPVPARRVLDPFPGDGNDAPPFPTDSRGNNSLSVSLSPTLG